MQCGRSLLLSKHFMHADTDHRELGESWRWWDMCLHEEVKIKSAGGPSAPDPLGHNSSNSQWGTSDYIPYLFSTFVPLSACDSAQWYKIIYTVKFVNALIYQLYRAIGWWSCAHTNTVNAFMFLKKIYFSQEALGEIDKKKKKKSY